MESNTQFKTNVLVQPSRSQVLLILLVLLSGVCFVTGFAFLWEGKPNSWVPFIIGIPLCIFVITAWFRAQKDTDLENSNPTTIRGSDGNSITTDTRALLSPQSVQNMEKLLCAITHREPLPEPDGLVDENGVPIPNSKIEAQERVNKANMQAGEITDVATDQLGLKVSNEVGTQPLLDEPFSQAIIDTNEERKLNK